MFILKVASDDAQVGLRLTLSYSSFVDEAYMMQIGTGN